MKRFHRFFGNYEPVSGCILSCFKMISAWFFSEKCLRFFFLILPIPKPSRKQFPKKECYRFRQASRFGCKGVCVFIWGMFHEFTYSMMIIIHDFCSGGTDSPSVVFLRRREGGLPGSVVVSPREVLHEESMPVASLSDLLSSPASGVAIASLSDSQVFQTCSVPHFVGHACSGTPLKRGCLRPPVERVSSPVFGCAGEKVWRRGVTLFF